MVVVSCGGDKRKSPANKNDFLFSGTENPVSSVHDARIFQKRLVILVSLMVYKFTNFTYMNISCGLSMML